jgi:hypothetical protein
MDFKLKEKECPDGWTNDQKIILVTKEETKHEFTIKQAKLSGLVCAALEFDSTATEIPIKAVGDFEMSMIRPYLEHHNGVPGALIEGKNVPIDLYPLVEMWDACYVDQAARNNGRLWDLGDACSECALLDLP